MFVCANKLHTLKKDLNWVSEIRSAGRLKLKFAAVKGFESFGLTR